MKKLFHTNQLFDHPKTTLHFIIVNTKTSQFIPIKYNIVTGFVNRFMLIKKDLLGDNVPNENFYITSGHKVIINGQK